MRDKLNAPVAAVLAWWNRLPGNLQGPIWMVGAAITFAAQNAVVKEVGERNDTVVIAFFRCLFGLVALLPFTVREGLGIFRTAHLWTHLSRSAVGISAMYAGFYSITHMPLANASALSYARPLFVVALSVVILKEVVGWRRWSATLVGFLGVLIIVRPGVGGASQGGTELGAIMGLAGAALTAVIAMLVKSMTGTERPITILAWFSTGSTIMMLFPALWFWRTPSLGDLGYLLLLGILSAAAQGWMIKAYQVAPASVVAPFDYTRLLFAGLYGYLFFSEMPDGWAWVGTAIVIGSALYIAHREATLGKRRTPPSALP